jgi:hypothetical protein
MREAAGPGITCAPFRPDARSHLDVDEDRAYLSLRLRVADRRASLVDPRSPTAADSARCFTRMVHPPDGG